MTKAELVVNVAERTGIERKKAEKAVTAIFETIKTFKHGEDSPAKKFGNPKKFSTEFLVRYVEKHFLEKISFAELADAAHISRSYLSKRFKEEFGVSFSEYLLSFRLNKAKKILESEKNISCKEAALRAGYTDYAQFTKMFKKFVGLSPSDYQKNSACV